MAEQRNVQRFGPVLVYDDAGKAIEFLTEAFGFTEHAVHRTPDGAIAHAELEYGGSFIGLSDRPPGERSIFDLGPCAIYVVVDDPDAHHDRSGGGRRRGDLSPHRPGLRIARLRGA